VRRFLESVAFHRLGVPLTDVGDAVRVHQREDLRK
jgi:hypothetical protein